MLVENLKPDDTVAIVTYANNTRVALEPTKALDKGRILAGDRQPACRRRHLWRRRPATRLCAGRGQLRQDAPSTASILATDGDFNIGISDHTQLKTYVEGKRQTGIFLSVLGVGRGNHNDRLMQALAQNGNGVAAYIDTLSEARKVLIEEASSSLFPIAKDVKIQIEFNPASVQEYRLIGYETRASQARGFQQRSRRCWRCRLGPHRDGALRDRAGRRQGRAPSTTCAIRRLRKPATAASRCRPAPRTASTASSSCATSCRPRRPAAARTADHDALWSSARCRRRRSMSASASPWRASGNCCNRAAPRPGAESQLGSGHRTRRKRARRRSVRLPRRDGQSHAAGEIVATLMWVVLARVIGCAPESAVFKPECARAGCGCRG